MSAPPKKQRRAGDIGSIQSTIVSDVVIVQSTAEQAPEETNILPVIGNVALPDPPLRYVADYRSQIAEEDVFSMTVSEAEVHENSE